MMKMSSTAAAIVVVVAEPTTNSSGQDQQPTGDNDNNNNNNSSNNEEGMANDLMSMMNDDTNNDTDDREDSPATIKRCNYITRFMKPNQNYAITMFQYIKKRKAYSRVRQPQQQQHHHHSHHYHYHHNHHHNHNFIFHSQQNLYDADSGGGGGGGSGYQQVQSDLFLNESTLGLVDDRTTTFDSFNKSNNSTMITANKKQAKFAEPEVSFSKAKTRSTLQTAATMTSATGTTITVTSEASNLPISSSENTKHDLINNNNNNNNNTEANIYENNVVPSNTPAPGDTAKSSSRKKKTKKPKAAKSNKVKSTKSKDKAVDLSISLALNETNEDLDTDAENERKLRMLEEMESGGAVEDIDLTTDDWINVNPSEMAKRYDMMRRYATVKIRQLKNDYTKLETTDKEKIDKLKRQYFEHKKLWETERLVLLNVKDMEFNWDQERSEFLDQAEAAIKLQQEAQQTAEKAIKQLEDFISEDAQLDRENAENTIQLLRERSRTLTTLSLKKNDSGGGEEDSKAPAATETAETEPVNADEKQDLIIRQKSVLVNNDTEKSEKIPVLVENATIKFPNKQLLDKIVEYINFESSNRFTLVFGNATLSRPGTRSSSHKSSLHSAGGNGGGRLAPKSSNSNLSGNKRAALNEDDGDHLVAKQIVPGERKNTKTSAQLENSIKDFNNNESNNNTGENNEIIDQVLTKILTEDEVMINELKNSVKNRNELRSKHMAQLEESKANLNEIKSKAAIQLIPSNSVDQEFPPNEDETLEDKKERKSAGRVQTAERMRSGMKSSSSSKNILSHPIVIEYIKAYDIVVNFISALTKSMPAAKSAAEDHHLNVGVLGDTYEKLSEIKMFQFNEESTVTPQIIKMTSFIDNALSEIQMLFSQMVDGFVLSKYEQLESESKIVQLKQQQSRPSTTKQATGKLSTSSNKDATENIDLDEKEMEMIKKKETSLLAKEKELSEKEKLIEEKKKEFDNLQAKLNKEREELEKKKKEAATATAVPVSGQKEAEQQQQLVTKLSKEVEETQRAEKETKARLGEMVNELDSLKKTYEKDTHQYLDEIEFYKNEIKELSKLNGELNYELQHAKTANLAAENQNSNADVEKIYDLKDKEQQKPFEFPKIMNQKSSRFKLPHLNQSFDNHHPPAPNNSHRLLLESSGGLNFRESIMFTRLDAERNSRRLEYAVNRGILSDHEFKSASIMMKSYISLPLRRLTGIIKKYISFRKLKEIEENLKKTEEKPDASNNEILEKLKAIEEKVN